MAHRALRPHLALRCSTRHRAAMADLVSVAGYKCANENTAGQPFQTKSLGNVRMRPFRAMSKPAAAPKMNSNPHTLGIQEFNEIQSIVCHRSAVHLCH